MNILAIDTTTNKLLVAVKKGDELFKNQPQTTSKHLEVTLPQIEHVLGEAQIELSNLDYIAVNVGPGSFTGIRIGIATAKGILMVYGDIKTVPVNSLEFLAYNVREQKKVDDFMVVIPSTLEKLYSVTYKDGKKVEEKIITRDELKSISGMPIFSNEEREGLELIESNGFVEYVEYLIKNNKIGNIRDLKPIYMSLCQAEEELLKKEKNKNGI